MRVNRQFLYWGVFLIALGGVLIASDLRGLDAATIGDVLRLWPLALVAIGLALVLRRTRYGVPTGMLAVAVPGLMLGGAFAVAPRFSVDCAAGAAPASVASHEGTFEGPARVSVTTGCGSLVVGTAAGSGWRLDAGSTASREPRIDASSQALSITTGGREGWRALNDGRDDWRLTLPTTPIDDLALVVNAGHGRVDLADARLGTLDLTTNAAQTSVDLSGTGLASLTGTVNAGLLSVRLPASGDLSGTVDVNAGALQLCVPAGLGLRVHHTGVLDGVSVGGRHQSGADWESPDYASATHHADLTVSVNLGSVEIDPIGGCK